MLRLLLDEHISPKVASGLRRRIKRLMVHPLTEWEGGILLGQEDEVLLRAALAQRLTLVTHDRRTIPPLLKLWAEEERTHGGVIFVDEKSIPPADIGGLVLALEQLATETRRWDWGNRVVFLRR